MSAVKYITRENGEKYPVRYDVNALCQFEEISGGKTLLSGTVGFDVRCMRALVYVGLVCGHEFEKKDFLLTPLDIGRWDDMMKVTAQCTAILNEMIFGVKQKGKKGEDKKPGE
jgi:hypothetical protein